MAIKTMIDILLAKKREYEASLAELGGQEKVLEFTKELGALLPKGKVLVWRQYTPYFNDGNPCRFGVHAPYIHDVGWAGSFWDGDGPSDSLGSLFDSIPSELMEKMFGDGYQIEVRSDGTYERKEHDHD